MVPVPCLLAGALRTAPDYGPEPKLLRRRYHEPAGAPPAVPMSWLP
jgi:hypothetical protein